MVRILTVLMIGLLGCPGGTEIPEIPDVLREADMQDEWRAGEIVSAETVVRLGGVDRCFASEEIPDAVWARMLGKTYRANPYVKRSDLRYLRLLHCDNEGKIHLGEMVCNKRIARLLVDIFRKLYDASYPIGRMVLPDEYDADDERQMRDNNTSCFCYRAVAKSAQLSLHARGLAVDLNPLYNPYYKRRADGTLYVQPSTARQYCDRSKSFPYKIDENDLAYKLFTANGFKWGGHWRTCKDFQHFEINP